MRIKETLKVLLKPLPSLIWNGIKQVLHFLFSERFREWLKLISLNLKETLNGFYNKYGEQGFAYILMCILLVCFVILSFMFA